MRKPKKEKVELPLNALHMLETEPTSMPVEVSQVFRVYAVAHNAQTQEYIAQLVGPILLPDGVDQAIERIIAWFDWVEDPASRSPNPYDGFEADPSEDLGKLKWWYEAMKGKDAAHAQNGKTA